MRGEMYVAWRAWRVLIELLGCAAVARLLLELMQPLCSLTYDIPAIELDRESERSLGCRADPQWHSSHCHFANEIDM